MSNHFFHVMIWRHPFETTIVSYGCFSSQVVIRSGNPRLHAPGAPHQNPECIEEDTKEPGAISWLYLWKNLTISGFLVPKRGEDLLSKLVVWVWCCVLFQRFVVQKVAVHSLYENTWKASSATASIWLLLTTWSWKSHRDWQDLGQKLWTLKGFWEAADNTIVNHQPGIPLAQPWNGPWNQSSTFHLLLLNMICKSSKYSRLAIHSWATSRFFQNKHQRKYWENFTCSPIPPDSQMKDNQIKYNQYNLPLLSAWFPECFFFFVRWFSIQNDMGQQIRIG